jgi:carbonic anhydrase/acetyltransferase-like protein (isoleucine patch superfamily)
VLIEHLGKRPTVDPSAFVAPTATIVGDVTIGPDSRVMFGAVVAAQGGPILIGMRCIVMENAVVRGISRHPTRIGHHVLIGPHASLSGCTVEDDVFVATGAAVFNGAKLETRSEVRVNGVVHVNTRLPAGETVPIGWVAVGDPAEILPPFEHERIWAVQQQLDFPGTVFGLQRADEGRSIMPELTRRYTKALDRHRKDRPVEE